jgi:2-polyprenyl-3-methyl-5-hydroxy-6-metoxy-1,4-benzoquinol methylase
MTRCPLCGASAGPPFLVRDAVPVHQNLPLRTAAEARAVARGRLAMVACAGCGFVFNAAFDAGLLRYGAGYDNTQSHSALFDCHLTGLVRHMVEERAVRGARIVEVGCGTGDFLRRLVAWPGTGNTGTGFDPTYEGPAEIGGRLRFQRRFYGPDCADVPADVVVCRHVIEHIADPPALLASVRAALRDNPAARVFFETPDVTWSLRHGVAWDFFYEHCSLFTAESLAVAFAGAGFAAVTVRPVFAGQYLWLEARPGSTPVAAADPAGLVALARGFGGGERTRLATWRARIDGLDGPVAVWGAGAKGVTFAGLADPDASRIDCLVDINPAKQGRFVPGTGHPIVAPEALAARGVRHVLPMNPAYRAEITPLLAGARLAAWDA